MGKLLAPKMGYLVFKTTISYKTEHILPRTPITPPTIPPDRVPLISSDLPLYCKKELNE